MRLVLTLMISLCLALPASAQGKRTRAAPAADGAPLLDLLQRIPADAEGPIYLTDIAAARRNVDPLTNDAPSDADRLLAPHSSIMLPPGFDQQRIMLHLDDPAAALGISVFGFDQMAGWGELPESPILATGISGYESDIIAAFERDGLMPKRVGDATVWHIRDDFQMDFRARTDSPFGGNLGVSQRFRLDGDLLMYTRSWPGMNLLLNPDPNLAQEADTAAILRTVYALDGVGDVINVLVIPEQPPKAPDPALLMTLAKDLSPEQVQARIASMPEFALPGLPPFLRFALVLWQDGRDTTGAIVIPYTRRDTAETARDRFTALLDSGTSMTARRPFAEILAYPRRFEIVETSNRHVLVLGFTEHADPAEPVNLMTFMRNPQNRLYQMYATRDLPLLIGFSE